jgi:hypothetical protein
VPFLTTGEIPFAGIPMAMHMMYSLKPKIILGYKSLLHEQTVRLNRCTEANKKCYKMNWEVCTFLRKYL